MIVLLNGIPLSIVASLNGTFSVLFFTEAGTSALRKPCGRRVAFCANTPKLRATDRLRSNPFFILIGSIKLDNNLGSIYSYKFREMIRLSKHILTMKTL